MRAVLEYPESKHVSQSTCGHSSNNGQTAHNFFFSFFDVFPCTRRFMTIGFMSLSIVLIFRLINHIINHICVQTAHMCTVLIVGYVFLACKENITFDSINVLNCTVTCHHLDKQILRTVLFSFGQDAALLLTVSYNLYKELEF